MKLNLLESPIPNGTLFSRAWKAFRGWPLIYTAKLGASCGNPLKPKERPCLWRGLSFFAGSCNRLVPIVFPLRTVDVEAVTSSGELYVKSRSLPMRTVDLDQCVCRWARPRSFDVSAPEVLW